MVNNPPAYQFFALVDYGEQQLQEAQEALTTDMMILAISVYLVIAAVTTSLAGCPWNFP